MTRASSLSRRHAHAAAVNLATVSGEVTSPTEGVLRLLFRREDNAERDEPRRGNYPLAVKALGELRPLEIVGNRVEAEGIALVLNDDATLDILGTAPDRTLERVLRVVSVHSTEEMVLAATLGIGRDDPFFGMGEPPGPMNHRHRRVVNWNFDYAPHTPSLASFYSSFPIYVSRSRDVLDRSVWYGLFLDNPGRSSFEFAIDAPDQAVIAARTGDLDLYLMTGPTPADVVHRWCALTGTMEMPPKWLFGYQQSRWSYFPAERVLEVARLFRHHRFPCDILYLDIDYMDGFRAFTWDPETFPDPKGLIQDLQALGFKVMPILNSAVAVDPHFPIYAEGHEKGYFLKRPDGEEYQDQMWPGRAAFPDFTREDVRKWWSGLHAQMLDLGVDGIWNDMNEPTVFGPHSAQTFPPDLVHEGEGMPRPHEEVHNAYGMLMDVATREGLRRLRPGRRMPLLTRSGWAGVQRLAVMWTGDNSAWWEHMRMCIGQVCNLGLSGVPISGPDMGGFQDNPSGEMFLRWLEMCVFFPYLRGHSAQGTRPAEPWVFGEEVLESGRRFVELRYQMLPYIYSLAARSSRCGDPIMRPLFYEFPQDPSAEVADDQFMLGPDLLIAPILAPGRFYRAVYLPEGEWFSFFGETLHEGAGVIVAETPLSHIPVYVRANAIVPMAEPMQYVGEEKTANVQWHVWASSRGEGRGWLFEDDGETDGEGRASRGFCETHVSGTFTEERINVRFEGRVGEYDPGARRFAVVVHGRRRAPRACNLDAVTVKDGRVCVEFDDDATTREIVLEW